MLERKLPAMTCNPQSGNRSPSSSFGAFAALLRLVAFWLSCAMALHVAAQPVPRSAPTLLPAGTVKTVSGQAFLDFNGQRAVAALGMPVYLGSRLVTLPGSTLGVTFRDETVVSIGPDTQLVIDQYLFAPRKGEIGLVASLARGTLNYVSGQIAKLKPDGVNINTPTGMIGVRGTQFVVRVDPS